MSAQALHALHRRLRVRRALYVAAWTLPLLIAAGAVLLRFMPPPWAYIGIAILALISVALMVRSVQSVAMQDVVRVLDDASPQLEDSADLVLGDPGALTPLQRLQRERVLARLGGAASSTPMPAFPTRRFVFASALAVVVFVFTLIWPGMRDAADSDVGQAQREGPVVATQTRLVSTRIDIEAPAYTALPPRSESTLEVETAEGSILRWHVVLDPSPSEARLTLHDGTEIALGREGEGWSGTHVLRESTLYRIDVGDAPPLVEDRLYRLDAIADLPPDIRVIAPDRTLSLLEQEQPTWPLQFEVSDDYGVGVARLTVTLAQGSGEQIAISEQELILRGAAGGNPRQRGYRHALDLGALGFASGDDLIVRLGVSDTRTPTANTARSASYILRWPSKLSAEAEGIDGIVQKVLPAYFRSQRQIIIDSEALIAERPTLAADEFVKRSDAIGVDQKILRLRYGQFLGEEFESGGGPGPTASEKDEDHEHEEAEAADAALPEGHSPDDGHDHTPAGFGNASEIVAEYGHTHDYAEAATLLDPETRRILKAALAEMWQAELQLRLGKPADALPYENRALEFIKQVQQSTRIYLARVGLELPQVDEKRRLTGDRGNARSRTIALAAATSESAALVAFHDALASGGAPSTAGFEAWLREHETGLEDGLGVVAALDAWRRDADCAPCRERLLDVLWPLLPAPATGVAQRARPGDVADVYFDSLREQEQP